MTKTTDRAFFVLKNHETMTNEEMGLALGVSSTTISKLKKKFDIGRGVRSKKEIEKEREVIFAMLKEKPMTIRQVAELLEQEGKGVSLGKVKNQVWALAKEGRLVKEGKSKGNMIFSAIDQGFKLEEVSTRLLMRPMSQVGEEIKNERR